jgi:hypothetical protein
MSVRSEKVKPAVDLAVLPDRIPDLLDIPDYKLATIIDQIWHQNED